MSTKIEQVKARLTKIREAASETMGEALKLAETAAAASAISWANGRYGKIGTTPGSDFTPHYDVAGMPIDVGTAVVLHGASFAGLLGKYKEHGHNLANGALCSYAGRKFLTMGMTAKNKATQAAANAPPKQVSAGWQGAWDHVAGQQQPENVNAWRGVG